MKDFIREEADNELDKDDKCIHKNCGINYRKLIMAEMDQMLENTFIPMFSSEYICLDIVATDMLY